MGLRLMIHSLMSKVLAASYDLIPWFTHFFNYFASDLAPSDLSFYRRKKFMYDVTKFFWEDPYLFHVYADGIICRCVPEVEMMSILKLCHSSNDGEHHSGIQTAHKILHYGDYWRTIHQYSHDFIKSCARCQREGGISKKQELPMNLILVIELFDVWGLDFMGPFVSSHGMKYILVAVDYVTK